MRELKFQAIALEGGIIEDVVPLRGPSPEILEIQTLTCLPRIKKVKAIRQYTDLHDKNGKEIYEGDIISMHSKRLILDDIRNIKYYEEEYVNFSESEMEIIGNIYENPKLVK